MCKEAVDAGTCPDDCDSCAWSMDLADAMCVPDTCEYVFSKYRVLLTRRRDL